MPASPAATLLSLWDRGQALAPGPRALALLPPLDNDEQPATLPVGGRDARLLKVRESLFGPELQARTDCPACHEPLEFALSVADLAAEADPSERGAADPLHFEHAGWEVEFRVPRCEDLEVVRAAPDASSGLRRLLERCVLRLHRPDRSPGDWSAAPPGLLAGMSERMAEADPFADVRLDLTCPACRRNWVVPLRIDEFLWEEIRGAASRLILEVHELARAYGWSEASILDLAPARRQAYLALVRA